MLSLFCNDSCSSGYRVVSGHRFDLHALNDQVFLATCIFGEMSVQVFAYVLIGSGVFLLLGLLCFIKSAPSTAEEQFHPVAFLSVLSPRSLLRRTWIHWMSCGAESP